MKKYLLNLINRDLMWVQVAAYGMAWYGYCRKDINAADSVKQILRVAQLDSNTYVIEFWERNRMSTYTMHASNIEVVTNQLIDVISIITKTRYSYVRIP